MAQELALVIEDPGPEAGPAMAQLTPMQRRFVMAMLAIGDTNLTQCAKLAGFGGEHPQSVRNAGHTLGANPKIRAAIHEQAEMRLASGKIMAVSQLLKMASGPTDTPQKLKALLAVLNRTGFHEVSEHHVVTTNMNDELESDLDQLAHWAKVTNTTLAPEFQRLIDTRRKKLPDPERVVEIVQDIGETAMRLDEVLRDPDEDILGPA